MLDAVTFFRQAAGEICSGFAVVFDEQNLAAHWLSGGCNWRLPLP
jgi:hypothetical protein